MDKKRLAIIEIEGCIKYCFDLYKKDAAGSEIFNIVNKLNKVVNLLNNK